jgi:hypothetical protein
MIILCLVKKDYFLLRRNISIMTGPKGKGDVARDGNWMIRAG